MTDETICTKLVYSVFDCHHEHVLHRLDLIPGSPDVAAAEKDAADDRRSAIYPAASDIERLADAMTDITMASMFDPDQSECCAGHYRAMFTVLYRSFGLAMVGILAEMAQVVIPG